ncbi:MAG: hypothetical protein B7Z40_21660 [Bosea sp. 12-68-7]|nr:MAG: hypothetical protein B7Z40_21660 [Bosea sp. 12-68-7]
MRSFSPNRYTLAGLALLCAPLTAEAQTVTAGPAFDVSVTVYRDPDRDEGGFDLDYLGGFALITESRRVVLQPGEQTLRFEGVADGIEPVSAIVTGLASGVVEKNRDAKLLSPSALVEAAAGQERRVDLMRTDPKTGVTTRSAATIRAGENGVVLETSDGIEALRCSGLSETVSFEESASGLSSTPTLSIRTRVTEPVEAVIQLSYLARGFDWSADYVADRVPGASTLNLGAWITLANGNGVSFDNARVQIVAGKLNRESGQVEPIDIGGPIFAQCWPRGSTSDYEPSLYFAKGRDAFDSIVVTGMRMEAAAMAPPPPPPPPPAPVPAEPIQEDLGDLKLYRLTERVSVLSRQAKQVRMFDRADVPVARIYEINFTNQYSTNFVAVPMLLRTQNDKESNLGLPLPQGRVQMFEQVGEGAAERRLLAGETTLRDIAVDEETEFEFSGAPDIQARQIVESRTLSPERSLPWLPLLRVVPGINSGLRTLDQVNRIEVSNARPYDVTVEVRLYLQGGAEIVRADAPYGQKNGRPIFRLTVPANDSLTVRYQTTTYTR